MVAVISRRTALAMTAALVAPTGVARAQNYPMRPITVIVPNPPGGASDILTRLVADKMRIDLGQNVLVDNRPGGSGTLGLVLIARAAPDGYTIGFSSHNVVLGPMIIKGYEFDPLKEFKPISYLADTPVILVTRSEANIKTVADLVAYAKAQKNPISVGIPGTSVRTQLGAFTIKAGIEVEPVSYQGSAPLLQAVAAGEIDVALDAIISTKPFIESGVARVIAVGGDSRSPILPEVPTIGEAGYDIGGIWNYWYSFVGPAGMSEAMLDKLHESAAKALRSPDVQARAKDLALNLGNMSRKEFGDLIVTYQKDVKAIVDAIGLKPE